MTLIFGGKLAYLLIRMVISCFLASILVRALRRANELEIYQGMGYLLAAKYLGPKVP